MRLFQIEFELFALAVTLALLIFLPVLDAFLMPLFHEAGVALKFVDLNTAHFLLAHGGNLGILGVAAAGVGILAIFLLLERAQVTLHVERLLRLIEGVDACLEEGVLHAVVRLLGVCNFLCRLIVAELSRLGEHGDVGHGVNLLEAHLELIEKAQGDTSLAFHNLVDHLGVEFDVQVAKCGLQLLEVL